MGGDEQRQQWRRAIQISEGLLLAGLADLEAHPEVEEGIGHQHQHDVAVLLGELDRHRHVCRLGFFSFVLLEMEIGNESRMEGGCRLWSEDLLIVDRHVL